MTDCIPYSGWMCAKSGYGKRQYHGTVINAHRALWQEAYGPLPRGVVVRHLCGNRACVNLAHLAAGSYTDNNRDTVVHGRHRCSQREHCPKGHAYDAANTYVDKAGSRHCRTCKRETWTRWWMKSKGCADWTAKEGA